MCKSKPREAFGTSPQRVSLYIWYKDTIFCIKSKENIKINDR